MEPCSMKNSLVGDAKTSILASNAPSWIFGFFLPTRPFWPDQSAEMSYPMIIMAIHCNSISI